MYRYTTSMLSIGDLIWFMLQRLSRFYLDGNHNLWYFLVAASQTRSGRRHWCAAQFRVFKPSQSRSRDLFFRQRYFVGWSDFWRLCTEWHLGLWAHTHMCGYRVCMHAWIHARMHTCTHECAHERTQIQMFWTALPCRSYSANYFYLPDTGNGK